MLGRREAPLDGKVTPEMAMFIQLDELNGRLAEVADLLRQARSTGKQFTQVLAVTTVPQYVWFRAYGYTVYNDGAGAVFTGDTQNVVTVSPPNASLASGESDVVNLGSLQDVAFWIATSTGTATVRIRAVR